MGRIRKSIKLLEVYLEEHENEKRLDRLKEVQMLVIEEIMIINKQKQEEK